MLREHTRTGIHTEISRKDNRSHIFDEVNDFFLIRKTFSVPSQKKFFFTVSICQLLNSFQNGFLFICHDFHLILLFIATAFLNCFLSVLSARRKKSSAPLCGFTSNHCFAFISLKYYQHQNKADTVCYYLITVKTIRQ